MKKSITVLALILLANLASIAKAESFLDALAVHESGNRPLPASTDVNGKLVIGFFQISKAYWQDATEHSGIGGTWEQCGTDREYAERVVMAYMDRYCPTAVKTNNYEVMARTHNGGPAGAKRKATVGYWHIIKALMEQ